MFRNGYETGARSEADARLVFLMALASALLPALVLVGADFDADLLDDEWEEKYGLSTNAVAGEALAGWWQLDATNGTTAVDRGTNGLALTVVEPGANPWTTNGVFYGALTFDGAARYLQAQTNPAYNLLASYQ